MNDKLFNYIYDAMNLALELMDDNLEPIECEKERNKLDKAIGLFYDWYQTAHTGLEEIQSICIGADSPDANTLGEQDPAKELQNCRADLSAISNIVEELLIKAGVK